MSYSAPPRWAHGNTVSAASMQVYSDDITALYAALGGSGRNHALLWSYSNFNGTKFADSGFILVHRYQTLIYRGDGELVDPSGVGDTVNLEGDGTNLVYADLAAVDWLTPGKLYQVKDVVWAVEADAVRSVGAAGSSTASLTGSGTSTGGVTNHMYLTNIGTNTHAQIDTALSRLANTSGTNTGDQVVPVNTTGTAGQYFSAYNATTGAFTKGTPDHTAISNVGTNTHAQIDTALTRLANTSGTNTGDQTVPVNTAGTSGQFFSAYNSSTGTFTKSAVTASDVGLGSVENTALSTWAGSTNITTLGTVTTGTWSGTTLAVNKGGTGQTSYTDGQLLIGNSTGNTLAKATLTQGSGITITNGGGSITVANAGVTSFNSRTGEVSPASNDYTWAQINKATSSIADITTRSHGDLTGLTTGDPHTQYGLLAGRSGGQTLIGGTAADNTLVLQANSASASNTATTTVISVKVGNSGGTTALSATNAGRVSVPVSLAVGGTPAQTGELRISNNQSIWARNAANTGDVEMIKVNASNVVQFGTGLNLGNQSITGVYAIEQNTAANWSLDNAGNATFAGLVTANTLKVGGNALTVGGTSSINGTAVVTTGTQSVAGAKTFSDAVTFSAAGTALSVTNNATIGGTLAVTGNTTLTGTLTVNGAGTGLTVANNTTLSGTLGVTGASTFTGETINGAFARYTLDAAVIAGGVITATATYMTVDTEGGATTDDLDTINGHAMGRLLILRTLAGTKDVTLKDGTGNLRLNGDCPLTNQNQTITLIGGASTTWLEIARSLN